MAIPAPRGGSAALITGASSGIGEELARQLCARGHDAVLVARRRDRLEGLATELREKHGRRVEVLACDISDGVGRDGLAAQVDALGLQIDVLALCAGFGMTGPFLSHEPARIVQMARTNLESVLALSHAFASPMAARRSGAILIVSSMAGNQPMPYFAAYSATKAAVTSFAQALHSELAPDGITVTALCPGSVTTEFADVAGATRQEEQLPSALKVSAEECARTGLDALERGRRTFMPRAAVRTLAFFGKHAPRSVWLPVCRRLLS